MLAACSGPAPEPAPTSPSWNELAQTPSQLFGAGAANPFTQKVTNAPLHGDSAAMMSGLEQQIDASGGGVVINTAHFNSTLWVATPDTPRVRIAFDNCQKKPDIPAQLYDGAKFFVDVPMPERAAPAAGTDGALAVWSPSTDQLWEFWVAKKSPSGWSACWGGRIDHLASSHGAFPPSFGASASGLATVGSMITVEEARRGRIEHAMNLGLKFIGDPNRIYYPATRSDGKDPAPAALPMGSRLRLDPSVDVDALKITPLAKAVARAAQTYGFIVTETSGAVGIGAESGLEEKSRTGTDPWPAILGLVPDYSQMDGFPWEHVRVLEADYGKPGAPSGSPSATASG